MESSTHVSSPTIGHPNITTYHIRNRALYHTETYSSGRWTVGCPAERDVRREGGKEKLERDALSWNEAQLLEAVLGTSTLKAAGRGLAVRGCVRTWKGTAVAKKPPCNSCLIWSLYCFIIKMAGVCLWADAGRRPEETESQTRRCCQSEPQVHPQSPLQPLHQLQKLWVNFSSFTPWYYYWTLPLCLRWYYALHTGHWRRPTGTERHHYVGFKKTHVERPEKRLWMLVFNLPQMSVFIYSLLEC